MPLSRFVLTLDAVERITAEERLSFTMDMVAVTSNMFAGKGKTPLKDHVQLLQAVINGEANGDK